MNHKYLVINQRTNQVVSRCTTFAGAVKALDRYDNKVGAYWHKIVTVNQE